MIAVTAKPLNVALAQNNPLNKLTTKKLFQNESWINARLIHHEGSSRSEQRDVSLGCALLKSLAYHTT